MPTPNAWACFISATKGALGGGIGGMGRQEAVHLVEHEERAQALGAEQRTDAGEHFFEQHAERERALFVVQVSSIVRTDWGADRARRRSTGLEPASDPRQARAQAFRARG